MKTFADSIFSLIKNMKFVFRMVENIVGKGNNAGYQLFTVSLQCFQRLLSQGR